MLGSRPACAGVRSLGSPVVRIVPKVPPVRTSAGEGEGRPWGVDSYTSHCHILRMSNKATHSLTELAELAGVTPRTIRYYIAQGLLPGPHQAGRGAHYTDSHLARLRLIRQLRNVHLPLAEIRRRLGQLDDPHVRELLAPAEHAGPETALDYVRSVLAGDLPPGPRRFTAWLASDAPAALATSNPVRIDAAPALPPAAVSRTAGFDVALTVRPPGVHPLAGRESTVAESTAGPTSGQSTARESTAGVSTAGVSTARESTAHPAVERSQWDRVALAPDIELHIRRPLSRIENRRVERLIALARDLLEEDQP